MPEFYEQTPECLDAVAMERLLDGRLTKPEESSARAHLDACDRCASELLLFEEFRRAEARPDEAAAVAWIERKVTVTPGRERSSWWSRWLNVPPVPRWAFSLAAVLLIVAVSLQLRRTTRPELEPGDGSAAVYRTGSIQLNAPAGDQASVPAEFSWNPAAGSVIYEIAVYEVDGSKVWSMETPDVKTGVPPVLASWLKPRKTLLWQVIAKDAAGRKVAESSREQFRILP